jgi:hypothetical protein
MFVVFGLVMTRDFEENIADFVPAKSLTVLSDSCLDESRHDCGWKVNICGCFDQNKFALS